MSARSGKIRFLMRRGDDLRAVSLVFVVVVGKQCNEFHI